MRQSVNVQSGSEHGLTLQVNDLLHQLVRIAANSTGARYAAIGVIAGEGIAGESVTRLATFITFGLSDADKAKMASPPSGRGMLGALIDTPVPVRVSEISRDPRSSGLPPGHPPMRTLLGVPIRIGEEVFGNLYLTEKIGGGDFTEADEAVAVALAAAAGVAVDQLWHRWMAHDQWLDQHSCDGHSAHLPSARLPEEAGSALPPGVDGIVKHGAAAAVRRERDRISRDLHDVVIQRLYAGGMELKSDIALVGNGVIAERLNAVVEEIDGVIGDLRRTIFDLRHVSATGDVQSEVTQLVARFESPLTFRPRVSFHGPVRWRVEPELTADVVAVIGEALSNVARHAEATSAQVEVAIVGRDLQVRVSDDGRGISGRARLSGVANLSARAGARGGTFRFGRRDTGGTELVWQVPLG